MSNVWERFNLSLNRPLATWARGLLVLAVIPLALSFVYPLWNISMVAPQYPNGLELDIYAYTIEAGNEGRDLQEINILNHYIGMKALDKAEFTDLAWIPFAIGALVLLALRVAAIGDVRALVDLAVLTVYFSIFSAGRFIFQLYNYGHNLDPQAPVRMEPFTPAIFGSKEIANFTTVSMPRAATFMIGIYATVVALLMVWHLLQGWSRTRAEPAG